MEFERLIKKDVLTTDEKVFIFNEWAKLTEKAYHYSDYRGFEFYLSGCKIKAPATEKGKSLLEYSVKKIKERFTPIT